jgi:threonine dehydratase
LPIVLVPASGGGLAAGIALGLEADLPGASVHVVEPEGYDDHGRSLAAGHRVVVTPADDSICDALLQPTPGEITWEVNRRLVCGAHAVSDHAVLRAMGVAFEEMRLIVEPGGAVGLAALLEGKVPGTGPVVVVLSGGNVDVTLLMQAISKV